MTSCAPSSKKLIGEVIISIISFPAIANPACCAFSKPLPTDQNLVCVCVCSGPGKVFGGETIDVFVGTDKVDDITRQEFGVLSMPVLTTEKSLEETLCRHFRDVNGAGKR